MNISIVQKIKALRAYLDEMRRRYRNRYSLLYPHGILRRIVRKYPQYSEIQVFIESGTFRGKTAMEESRYFREVHTVELNEKLYQDNLSKFETKTPNVKAYLGDSAQVLPVIFKEINEPCLIFLDAHWSGDYRVNWSESAWDGYGTDTSYRGDTWPPSPEQQCPFIDEANAIRSHFHRPGVLIIDDWSVVGNTGVKFKGEDWSSISFDQILNALGKERVLDYFTTKYEDKVRMVILLK